MDAITGHPAVVWLTESITELLYAMDRTARSIEPITWMFIVLGVGAFVMFVVVRPPK
jgi:hypothetical protein